MENLLFSIGFILEFVNIIIFYKVIYRRKLHRPKQRWIFFPLAGIYVLSLADQIFGWDSFLVSTLALSAGFLVSSMFTEIKMAENLKYWTVHFFFSLSIETGIREGLGLIFPFLLQPGNIEIIIVTCLEIMVLLCLSRLPIFQEPSPLILSGRATAILSASFGIVSVFLTFMSFINEFSKEKIQIASKFLLVFATFGFSAVAIILLYILRQREYFQNLAALENEYNKQQREYFHMLLEKEKETKKFRHDMRNHMLCIQGMAKAEDTAGIRNYLSDTLHVFQQISEKEYSIGNETVDVLLNHYLLPVRNGCRIEVDGTFGEVAHIPRMELCTIFSNILKNAVEAATNIPPKSSQEKIISIHASHGEKFMKVTVQNTYTGNIKIQDGRIITGKKDKKNHGFGIENICAAVTRCRGSFYYTVREEFFSAEIILPAKPSS